MMMMVMPRQGLDIEILHFHSLMFGYLDDD